MKTHTATQTIYKRFQQFIILGTVAILTVSTATAMRNIRPYPPQDAYEQNILGRIYYEEQDYKYAFYLWTKSAEQGNADAQYNLGVMYYHGQGVKQDEKKAFYLWTKSAEQGHADAQYNLGIMYENGDGVKKDLKQAFIFYFKASRQGHTDARATLEYLKLKIK